MGNNKFWKWGAAGAAVLSLAIAPALGGTAASAAADGKGFVDRVEGKSRYAVSANLSASVFAPGVEVAYVTSGEKFPDALSGGPAAAKHKGPMLLTLPTSIPAELSTELTELKPKKIVVLGGPATVSDSVVEQLKSYSTSGTVERIGGPSRYAVAATVSAKTFAPDAPIAFIASGEKFPDALSAGPAAGGIGGPVLLTLPTRLPAETVTELKRLKPKMIVVAGGPASVSASVFSALEGYAPEVYRATGASRYAVAAEISNATIHHKGGTVLLASGEKFPDALSGGPVGALFGAPMLLTRPDLLPAETIAELKRIEPNYIVVLGGPASVSEGVKSKLQQYTTTPPPEPTGTAAPSMAPETRQWLKERADEGSVEIIGANLG